ncbi:hypothetical protein OAQ04_04720 [Flavobacteriaceae bacterium]|nr:hypothetical protein [Flavobacteriaceae bacterium]
MGVTAKMELNEIGELAQKFWMEIPQHFPFVVLDEFVVMQNHVHEIICVSKSHVETLHATSLPQKRQKNMVGQIIHFPKNRPKNIHWHPLFVDLNRRLPSTPEKSTPNSHGNPVFMMSSLKMKDHSIISGDTSK